MGSGCRVGAGSVKTSTCDIIGQARVYKYLLSYNAPSHSALHVALPLASLSPVAVRRTRTYVRTYARSPRKRSTSRPSRRPTSTFDYDRRPCWTTSWACLAECPSNVLGERGRAHFNSKRRRTAALQRILAIVVAVLFFCFFLGGCTW